MYQGFKQINNINNIWVYERVYLLNHFGSMNNLFHYTKFNFTH